MSNELTSYKDVKEQFDLVLAELDVLKVTDDEELEKAADFLNKISLTEKAVKDYFEEDRALTYSIYKEITDQIKSLTDPLGKAKTSVKRMITEYRNAQQAIAKDATTSEAPKQEPAKPSSVIEYDVWSWDVVDIGKIPLKFLTVDTAAVNAVVKELKDMAQEVLGEGIKVTKRTEVKAKGR